MSTFAATDLAAMVMRHADLLDLPEPRSLHVTDDGEQPAIRVTLASLDDLDQWAVATGATPKYTDGNPRAVGGELIECPLFLRCDEGAVTGGRG